MNVNADYISPVVNDGTLAGKIPFCSLQFSARLIPEKLFFLLYVKKFFHFFLQISYNLINFWYSDLEFVYTFLVKGSVLQN